VKTILIKSLLLLVVSATEPATDAELYRELSEYFFGLSVEADITAIRKELTVNPLFVLHHDPNRNADNSVTGSLKKYKKVDSASVRNQLLIQITPATAKEHSGKEHVFFKLSVDYKLDDLPLALHDWEQMKADFKPFFSDASQKVEIGYHQEEIETLYLKKGHETVTIRILKFNSINHTISLEYVNIRKGKGK
jgi:hypothetical protein